jgi:hypothetical protein
MGPGKTNEIYATFSQRIKLALSFIHYKTLISQEAKAKRRKTSSVKGRLITRENPTMCCQKPGCEKTFLKYYVDKRGSTDWSQPRKYCCIEHSWTHFQQENPTVRCQKPGCTNTFLKYYVDKRRGRTHWNQPRKYCHELRMVTELIGVKG